jgi:hypothetical protein
MVNLIKVNRFIVKTYNTSIFMLVMKKCFNQQLIKQKKSSLMKQLLRVV